jgi:hypothetical protein
MIDRTIATVADYAGLVAAMWTKMRTKEKAEKARQLG